MHEGSIAVEVGRDELGGSCSSPAGRLCLDQDLSLGAANV